MKHLLILCFTCYAVLANAQGLISQATKQSTPQCGSHALMEDIDQDVPDFITHSNKFLLDVQNVLKHSKVTTAGGVSQINVVFHVVYNNNAENIPDSVFNHQIKVLNDCFRRRNADTSNMRLDFNGLVGDAKIEFKLADRDPQGNVTSGVTHTSTSIRNFGGILPYGPGQNAQIAQWVADSLFENYFRITEDSMGGKSAWDDTRYLNIWIGDLRIFEPKFNDFEEMVYFALATPPKGHINWPDSIYDIIPSYNQGVLIHYNVVGPNNPSKFKAPYNVYNGVVTTGKMLVHEVGHYLGLRHIWGDGNCDHDDFVDDTPKASAASQYNCISAANTCKDTINGKDLPNMIENYMDYSSGDCQNSFTKGQIAVMQTVLKSYRSPIVSTSPTYVPPLTVYPNPSHGHFTVVLPKDITGSEYVIYALDGTIVHKGQPSGTSTFNIDIDVTSGCYFMRLTTTAGVLTKKLLIE